MVVFAIIVIVIGLVGVGAAGVIEKFDRRLANNVGYPGLGLAAIGFILLFVGIIHEEDQEKNSIVTEFDLDNDVSVDLDDETIRLENDCVVTYDKIADEYFIIDKETLCPIGEDIDQYFVSEKVLTQKAG